MPMVESRPITGGVDSHGEAHTAAALDDTGTVLGVEEFRATSAGHQALLDWLAGFGPIGRVGMEGAGWHGAGLTRHLQAAGVAVVDTEGLDRQDGGQHGESDTSGAIGVARAAASGQARQLASSGDGIAEAIAALMVARGSAGCHHAAVVAQIRALVAAAPQDLGLSLGHLSGPWLVAETAALAPRPAHPVGYATRVALRELGRRAAYLDDQVARLDEVMIPLVALRWPGWWRCSGWTPTTP
jgi:transposase